MKHLIRCYPVLALALWSTPVVAQSAYQKPPPEVLEVLNAPRSPSIYRTPTMKDVLLAQWVINPSIAELAQAVGQTVGYRGTIDFDSSKPDGAPRKLMDVSLLSMYATGRMFFIYG